MNLKKEDFHLLMESVDQKMIEEKFLVHARPIQSILKIFNAHKVSGPLVSSSKSSLDYPVTELNLSKHVSAWYKKRYGEKLKIDPSPGRFPILIEAEPYVCNLPLTVGVGEPFLVLAGNGRFSNKRILNAVDFIKDLPEFVRKRLDGKTLENLKVIFFICMEVTKELKSVKSDLIKSGEADILNSCDFLVGTKKNPDLSAWQSLQFAEKMLKEYISKFKRPPYSHKIWKLHKLAKGYGYLPDEKIKWDLFGSITPDARYNLGQFDLPKAIELNHEAWKIGFNVLKQLPS